MGLPSYFRFLVCSALSACLLGAEVQAAPTPADGKSTLIDDASGGDTPAAREFRAGIQAQLKGDVAAARARFEAALKIDPNYAPALIGMAGVAQAQGNTQQVEQYLQRAERANPKSPDVFLAWGRHYMRTNQIERAEKSLLTARGLAPRTIPPLLELAEIYIRTPGRTGDAVRMYRAALDLDPGNKFAQYGLGISLAAQGQRAEALKALEKAAELTPKDPAAPRAIGLLYLESGELDKALASFDRGLARQPQFVPAMLDRADALLRLNRSNDAVAQAAVAEKLAPGSAEVQLRVADVYQTAQRWNEAESAYLRTIALAPNSPYAYNNLAWMTVLRNGDTKQAVAWARKAVELAPSSSPFYDTYGWAQRAAGDLAGAQASLQRAIELEPKVATYYYHLGLIQQGLKQNAAARGSLQRALELDPKLPQADEVRKLLKELA